MTSILSTIVSDFLSDCKSKKISIALVRLFRSSQLLILESNLLSKLTENKAYQKHLDFIDKSDKLFFVSYKHYLLKGLSRHERIQTAFFHYEYETKQFDENYFNSVYQGNGLTLWTSSFNDTVFDIRIMPGNDVLYEGGNSLVLHVNGERVCVISYSMVKKDIFLPNEGKSKAFENNSDMLILVTRRQQTRDYSYQEAFNKAFDRVMPAHMCMSALSAIAISQGYKQFLGISSHAHPSMKPELVDILEKAYDQFWLSLNGKQVLPFGYLTELPLYMKPIEEMDAKAKKRALERRKHLQDVYEQAHQAMLKHVLTDK